MKDKRKNVAYLVTERQAELSHHDRGIPLVVMVYLVLNV